MKKIKNITLSLLMIFTLGNVFAQKAPKADPSLEKTLSWLENNIGKYSFKYNRTTYAKKFSFDPKNPCEVSYTLIKGEDKTVCKFSLDNIDADNIQLSVDGKNVYLLLPCLNKSDLIHQTMYHAKSNTSKEQDVSKIDMMWISWEAAKNINEMHKLEKALKHAASLCQSGKDISMIPGTSTWLD